MTSTGVIASLVEVAVILTSLTSVNAITFGARETKGTISDSHIDEVSGLALSRLHKGVGYVHNDRGGHNRIFAVDINTGKKLATLTVKGVQNTDWEDLAYGRCVDDRVTMTPSRYCLYIAETGNNGGRGAKNLVYMVREPDVVVTADVAVAGTLPFSWSEPDAETLMISPDARLFLVSKVDDGLARMAELPRSAWNATSPVSVDGVRTSHLDLPESHSHDPQGGDISPNGRHVLLVAEHAVYYYSVPDGDYAKAITRPGQKVTSYNRVSSTEAISWSPDGQGFYVIAEGHHPTFYYYPVLPDGGPIVIIGK